MNALANYWLTCFIFVANCEKRAVPEYNLSDSGASVQLWNWLIDRGIQRSMTEDVATGFETGLWFASALKHDFAECDRNLL